ncbi:Methyltransferase domain-containing protein [Rhodococcus jostii]|uniref:Methyltransferase domain-containing protein n=2 Tax=Rhodococcus jostii TaxID=132919 RepID=A0A1H5MD38_RHOJO|nr:Methyltransferase domain-containing protein [Rhodococcus jostii]
MWSTALARGLIREDALRSTRYSDTGYIDLLESHPPTRRTIAQRAMTNRTVAAVYERLWRPVVVAALSLHGLSIAEERERAAAAMELDGGQRVLDVACGPGNFTSFFADRLVGDGFVIGVDNSPAMLERAVRDNSRTRAVYLHADAVSLPFDDRTFDAVCCFAALYLVAEPCAVLREMVRVLAPGGRIAVTTSYGRESLFLRKGLELGAALCGARVFDRTTVPAFLAAAGLIDVEQQLRGISQFVTARRSR